MAVAEERPPLERILPSTARLVGGRVTVGGVALGDLAREHGTPLYVYDEAALRERAAAYLEPLAAYRGGGRAAFACKAQASVAVLRVLGEAGLGADVASAGELAAARAAGIDGERLVVHGNNKSDDDVAAALDARAGLLVLDHAGELDQVARLAAERGRVQPVLVRVTPGIDPGTHPAIATGQRGSKFGFAPADALDALERVAALPELRPCGLHVHLGSQIRELAPYLRTIDWLADFVEDHGLASLPVLDLGGGLAVAYDDDEVVPDPRDTVERLLERLAEVYLAHGLPLPQAVLEPGRSIAAPAGVTLYTVGAVKRSGDVAYVAVDGGLSDNPRPLLYGARYRALLADRADEPATGEHVVVGKHCESGDVVARGELPAPAPGDVLCVPVTGAYAASMASTYNLLPRAAAVLVAGGAARLAVRRESVADLLAREA